MKKKQKIKPKGFEQSSLLQVLSFAGSYRSERGYFSRKKSARVSNALDPTCFSSQIKKKTLIETFDYDVRKFQYKIYDIRINFNTIDYRISKSMIYINNILFFIHLIDFSIRNQKKNHSNTKKRGICNFDIYKIKEVSLESGEPKKRKAFEITTRRRPALYPLWFRIMISILIFAKICAQQTSVVLFVKT